MTNRILVPVDFSEPSEVAVRHALQLATRLDASLDVLYVCPWLTFEAPTHFSPPPVPWGEELREHLDVWAQAIPNPEGRTVSTRVVVGEPIDVIVDVAARERFAMVVIGLHGTRALGHVIRGRLADKLARRAPCPVLTVHERDLMEVEA